MSRRPANPTDGSAHPARAAGRPRGARAELGAFVRGVGGLGRLLLIGAGFGVALVLLATTVLNNRQPDPNGDSRVVVPGVWTADDSRPNEAAQRAAERDAELDRARREADQASAKSGLGDPSEDPKGRQGSADDDHGPPVGDPRNERRPSEGAGASTPPDPEPSEGEPRTPPSDDGEQPTRPPTPKPTQSAEPTKAPDPAVSKSPTGSPKPAPSEPTEPSMEPTDQDPPLSPTPTPSATPTSTPRPGDDDECTIKLLGLCL